MGNTYECPACGAAIRIPIEDRLRARIAELKAERDRLREVVREALEDCAYALENIDDGHYQEGAANVDDAIDALREALEG